MNQKIKRLLADLILGAVMAALLVVLKWEEQTSVWHKLCDGCFATAVILIGVGALRAIRNKGTFDVMGYSMMTTVHTFLPFTRMNSPLEQREEDFLTYRERKQQNRKSGASSMIAGSVYLVLALVFLAVYYIA